MCGSLDLIAVVADLDHQQDHPHECQLLTTLHNNLAQAEDVWQSWLVRYRTLVQGSDTRAVLGTLGQHNPVYILRNHMAHLAIDHALNDDFSELERLFEILSTPYQIHPAATMADITPASTDQQVAVSCLS